MIKYYAVFDTNVLISSLLTKRTDTATAQVIEMIPDGRIIPLYNQEILNEKQEGISFEHDLNERTRQWKSR